MAPRKTPEIIDFREEEDATLESIRAATEVQTLEVSLRIDEGNLTNAKILRGQEAEIFDQEITDDDLEE